MKFWIDTIHGKTIEVNLASVGVSPSTQVVHVGGVPCLLSTARSIEAETAAELLAACEWVVNDMSFKAPEQFANENVHGRWSDRLRSAIQSAKDRKKIQEGPLTEEQLDQLTENIKEFGTVVFPDPYWFSEDPDNVYCNACAKEYAKRTGNDMDGGWDTEEDTSLFCETCGQSLAHTLTDYGVEQELKHFEQDGADLADPLTRYTLNNIAGGWPISHAERLYALIFGTNENNPEAQEV
jgi:hypothetical protein